MADTAQPLNQRIPVTNADGTPTDYFIRMMRDFSDNAVSNDEADTWEVQGGIGIDGGGPVSQGVTLDANVQEILDEVDDTHGAVLFRGAAGWEALPPGTAGQFLKTNGAAADPEWAASGGGSVLTPPTTGMFSISLNSPNATNLTNSLQMDPAAGAPTLRGLLTTLPGGNFSVRIKMAARRTGNFNGSGLLFRDNGGRYIHVGIVHNNGAIVVSDNFNSDTSFNSGAATLFFSASDDLPQWIRADFDASNNDISAFFSYDGVDWIAVGGPNNFLTTCDAFGIGCAVSGSAFNTWWQHYEVV